ncbi:hypothetical protein D0Z07_6213 [Hyphodiscus hymeniophilus]|uniref:Uncharacterized protein n=1 Tax=Hyphodiscus hymeniophilus TaxID=353542 RepID=A0A9P7AUQ1_9HELO|nr:hypothetical protein D0Z07_6213 [Hyphodiscus hymeniophilus]
MFSPPRRERAREGGEGAEDSHLPQGDCRYILLHPDFKGLRCACVGFALNRAIPGSTCDCGHQACYHVPEKEAGSVQRHELETLKEKINLLETELDRERHGGRVVERLGQLEELIDNRKTDNDTEIKNLYRGIGGLWQNVGALNKRTPYYDDHIEGLVDDVQRIRNRLIEIDDASMRVEDRVEALENASPKCTLSFSSRRRKASTPPSVQNDPLTDDAIKWEEPLSDSRIPLRTMITEEPPHIQSFRERVASVGSGSQAWTVHISFLPTLSQPFPFEKDTAAYKRCLSRGLHRVIAVPDSDSYSFITAIEENFAEILRGRPWQPLAAKICDAKNLRGLPMLRQLDEKLIGSDYDYEFLQKQCAVTDEVGKILDIYIAMSEDSITWDDLNTVTPFLDGLEASWIYDSYLDGPYMDSDNNGHDGISGVEKRPAAGDWSPTTTRTKRNQSEISRTSSFGSIDGEAKRPKMRRPTNASVEVVGRRAEAV